MAIERRALIVGIDYYAHAKPLHGCVNDASSLAKLLENNGDRDQTINFAAPILRIGPNKSLFVSEQSLYSDVRNHFSDDQPVTSLFYFAGHGHLTASGSHILASDSDPSRGIPLRELVDLANKCKARNSIIILDCCHSGNAGASSLDESFSLIKTGTTILTASTASQYARETGGRGVFTSLLIDALEGAAANLLGEITPGSIYAHIDQSLGPGQQRPVFKTNINEFVSLRRVKAPIELAELRRIKELFPNEGFVFQLDPSFEPERSGNEAAHIASPKPENVERFKLLQKYNRLNLLVPNDAPHMWHAAMLSKSCKLTELGEHYRRLADNKLI
jgi:hypothetical protein